MTLFGTKLVLPTPPFDDQILVAKMFRRQHLPRIMRSRSRGEISHEVVTYFVPHVTPTFVYI